MFMMCHGIMLPWINQGGIKFWMKRIKVIMSIIFGDKHVKSAIQRTIVTVFLFSLSTGYAQPSTQGASHKAAQAVVHPQVELDALVLQFPREAIGQLFAKKRPLAYLLKRFSNAFSREAANSSTR